MINFYTEFGSEIFRLKENLSFKHFIINVSFILRLTLIKLKDISF